MLAELMRGMMDPVRRVTGEVLQFCLRCKRLRRTDQINVEARIHHSQPIECLDRKDCERAKRKAAK